jgi:hypothetical protein
VGEVSPDSNRWAGDRLAGVRDLEIKERFIELRASGRSYVAIAEELGVSKQTLDHQEQSVVHRSYNDQLGKLNQELALAKMEAHEAELDVEGVLGFAEHLLFNTGRLWQEFGLDQKQRLQKVLFPNGLHFSDGFLGTLPLA